PDLERFRQQILNVWWCGNKFTDQCVRNQRSDRVVEHSVEESVRRFGEFSIEVTTEDRGIYVDP
ncbi:MAG: hypothetical protein ACRERD_28685, partial [Candidatus Binatia bacterium]